MFIIPAFIFHSLSVPRPLFQKIVLISYALLIPLKFLDFLLFIMYNFAIEVYAAT